VCLTPAESPLTRSLTDPQSGCKQEVTDERLTVNSVSAAQPRVPGSPPSRAKEFTTTVNGTFNATGIQQKGSLDMRRGWATIAVR
jgi:hypothetical protein